MPQIAQQDYIVIKPKEGRAASQDAECLRRLKVAYENGTIFDCVVFDAISAGENSLCRVLAYAQNSISVLDWANDEIGSLDVLYTPTQYSGLAAVQEAEDELSGEPVMDLPKLQNGEGFLYEIEQDINICVNDFKLSVTASGGKLTALEISDEKMEENFINIAWEDALKLIGLPIS